MNNFEDIKNKNIQEMAEWIEEMFSSNPCYCCVKKDINKCNYYEKIILIEWNFVLKIENYGLKVR